MSTSKEHHDKMVELEEHAGGIRGPEGHTLHRTQSLRSIDEMVPLPEDVYTLGFCNEIGGEAFYYALYVYLLKICFFTFLVLEGVTTLRDTPKLVPSENAMLLAAQFLMLPVAVTIQSDLISTIFIVANLKYSKEITKEFPFATKWKFYASNFCRGLDGFFSLAVNFVVLLTAADILAVFLNFAALQFLQTIDDMALELAVSGYLTDTLEEKANKAKEIELPRNHSKFLRSLDTVLFVITIVCLIIAWSSYHFGGA